MNRVSTVRCAFFLPRPAPLRRAGSAGIRVAVRPRNNKSSRSALCAANAADHQTPRVFSASSAEFFNGVRFAQSAAAGRKSARNGVTPLRRAFNQKSRRLLYRVSPTRGHALRSPITTITIQLGSRPLGSHHR